MNFERPFNMQRQFPVPNLSLTKGFHGYVSEFVLVDKAYYLPQTH